MVSVGIFNGFSCVATSAHLLPTLHLGDAAAAGVYGAAAQAMLLPSLQGGDLSSPCSCGCAEETMLPWMERGLVPHIQPLPDTVKLDTVSHEETESVPPTAPDSPTAHAVDAANVAGEAAAPAVSAANDVDSRAAEAAPPQTAGGEFCGFFPLFQIAVFLHMNTVHGPAHKLITCFNR